MSLVRNASLLGHFERKAGYFGDPIGFKKVTYWIWGKFNSETYCRQNLPLTGSEGDTNPSKLFTLDGACHSPRNTMGALRAVGKELTV